MKRGKLILFEGIDGCGKTTHAKLLSQWLKTKGHSVFHTKEPSRGQIGLLLRVYLKKETLPLIDALLFTADRAEHIDKYVKPALKQGKIVVQERSFYSTIAYQSAQGLSKKWLSDLNAFAVKPDITLLLDLEPSISFSRIKTNEKFEKVAFLNKVRKNYLALAKTEKFSIVEAGRSKKAVQETIRNTVLEIL